MEPNICIIFNKCRVSLKIFYEVQCPLVYRVSRVVWVSLLKIWTFWTKQEPKEDILSKGSLLRIAYLNKDHLDVLH